MYVRTCCGDYTLQWPWRSLLIPVMSATSIIPVATSVSPVANISTPVIPALSLTLSACTRVQYLFVCVCVHVRVCVHACMHRACVCVSFTTLEATLIYSAKNRHRWTANGIFKKLKSCKSAPSFRNSCLNSLHCTILAMATPTY